MIYKSVTKDIYINGISVRYTLNYKNVKNINLRVKSDGTLSVSAGRCVSQKDVEEFIISESEFVLGAIKRSKTRAAAPLVQYYTESEIKEVITAICKKVYPYFEQKGVKYPDIKFRKMVSRWGSCHSRKGVLTFNTYLMYAPIECIEFVVMHEFTHFLEANHQKGFYDELNKICPDWKKHRNTLKGINIQSMKLK